MPQGVFSAGVVNNESVDYLTTSYIYPNGAAITCSSGAVATIARPFMHGYQMYFERATLAYNSAALPLTVYGSDGGAEKPDLGDDGDPLIAFTSEIQAAVDAVSAGAAPALLSAQLARDALALCYKEIESVKKGRIVKV